MASKAESVDLMEFHGLKEAPANEKKSDTVMGSFGGASGGSPGSFSPNLEKLSKSSYLLFHPGPQNVVKFVPEVLVQQGKSITTPKKCRRSRVVGREVGLL